MARRALTAAATTGPAPAGPPQAGPAQAGPAPQAATTRRRPAIPWPVVVFAGLVAATGALLLYLTRGTTFWFDEWVWALGRRGWTASAFLDSHNGHLSLIPVAIYKILFVTAGLGDYAPYRVLVILGHLVCASLVFVYARRRVGDYLGLCAATLILLLSAAWQDILWPFQIAWLVSVAAGLGVLLALDRRDRRGDIAACVLVGVSLASSGIGIVIALGAAVDILWTRRRWRALWVVAVPGFFYLLWWVAYQQPTPTSPFTKLPLFIANEVSATAGALVGASAPRPADTLGSGLLLTIGRPLAVVTIGLMLWRLHRVRSVPSRVPALVAILVAFWVLTAITRAFLLVGVLAWASRYLYVGAVFLLLLVVELARGIRMPRWLEVAIGIGVLAATVSNLDTFRLAARDLRTYGEQTRADLAAVQISRPLVKPGYMLAFLPGSPLIDVDAGQYFAAARALGTPAYTPAQLASAPAIARLTADEEMIRLRAMTAMPAPPHPSFGGAPAPLPGSAGVRSSGRGCTVATGTNAAPATVIVRVPADGLLLRAAGHPASVGVRRYADNFSHIVTLPDGRPEVIRIAPDDAAYPWSLRVDSAGVTVCALR